MINPTKINQESQYIHDAEEKEELEERIKFANKDRSSNIPFHISEIRVCESCYDDFQVAMKKSRKQWCLRSVGLGILIALVVIIIISIGES
jgi:hypothetical protein